uniref:C2H2-type domain-containing protein n=1 Tax=Macrostomum lignano TaxID=282301 RepID=A0A1I8F2R8_9PLAT
TRLLLLRFRRYCSSASAAVSRPSRLSHRCRLRASWFSASASSRSLAASAKWSRANSSASEPTEAPLFGIGWASVAKLAGCEQRLARQMSASDSDSSSMLLGAAAASLFQHGQPSPQPQQCFVCRMRFTYSGFLAHLQSDTHRENLDREHRLRRTDWSEGSGSGASSFKRPDPSELRLSPRLLADSDDSRFGRHSGKGGGSGSRGAGSRGGQQVGHSGGSGGGDRVRRLLSRDADRHRRTEALLAETASKIRQFRAPSGHHRRPWERCPRHPAGAAASRPSTPTDRQPYLPHLRLGRFGHVFPANANISSSCRRRRRRIHRIVNFSSNLDGCDNYDSDTSGDREERIRGLRIRTDHRSDFGSVTLIVKLLASQTQTAELSFSPALSILTCLLSSAAQSHQAAPRRRSSDGLSANSIGAAVLASVGLCDSVPDAQRRAASSAAASSAAASSTVFPTASHEGSSRGFRSAGRRRFQCCGRLPDVLVSSARRSRQVERMQAALELSLQEDELEAGIEEVDGRIGSLLEQIEQLRAAIEAEEGIKQQLVEKKGALTQRRVAILKVAKRHAAALSLRSRATYCLHSLPERATFSRYKLGCLLLLRWSCAIDVACLLNQAAFTLVNRHYNQIVGNLRALTWLCKLLNFGENLTMDLQTSLLMLIALERCCISMDLRFGLKHFSPLRLKIGAALASAVILTMNLNYIWMYSSIVTSESNSTIYECRVVDGYEKIYSVIAFVQLWINVYIPVVWCNICGLVFIGCLTTCNANERPSVVLRRTVLGDRVHQQMKLLHLIVGFFFYQPLAITGCIGAIQVPIATDIYPVLIYIVKPMKNILCALATATFVAYNLATARIRRARRSRCQPVNNN